MSDIYDFSFAVVLPMYNEEGYAKKAIEDIFSVLESIKIHSTILAINDGSNDKTLGVLDDLKKDYPDLLVVSHKKNMGYGQAITTSINFGVEKGFDYLLFMDADLTQDPKYIHNFIPMMLRGHAMIKGSRYIGGGGVEGVEKYRIIVSKIGNWLARLLFRLPIYDYTNGFRAINTTIATKLKLSETGFCILMEELYQLKHFTNDVVEVPYTLSIRSRGGSKSNFSYAFPVFYKYLKYPIKSFWEFVLDHFNSGVRKLYD